MPENGNVLVDASVWIGFLDGDPRAVNVLVSLKYSQRIVICGQVKQGVLQGSRDEKALAKLEGELSIWQYEAEQPDDFVAAARIYAELRWRGVTIPAADCLIAAVAKRCGLQVCATDPHFAKIPDLRLFPI